METGEVVKAAIVTDLFYVLLVIDQQLTGITHSDFVNEPRIGFSAARFKEFAK